MDRDWELCRRYSCLHWHLRAALQGADRPSPILHTCLHDAHWRGHPTMNTRLVGRFEIGNGSQAVVVYRYVPEQEVKLPPEVRPRYFKGATESDLVNGPLNAVMWGSGPYGSTTFFDEAVDLNPTAPVG